MCGICGVISLNKRNKYKIGDVYSMMKAQRHRGPSDEGIFVFSANDKKNIYINEFDNYNDDVHNWEGILGFNRLSILDVSINGHQPMCTQDGNVIITFNGEIYNVKELRDDLISKGYTFKSHTDTEVILYLYVEYGFKKCLNMLNGMFSILVVDLGSNKVFLARDRFGIKPIYYMIHNGIFCYASEIKSLIQVKDFHPTINRKAVYETFVFNNIYNKTLINEVLPLNSGTMLSFDLYNRETSLKVERWFNFNSYKRSNKFITKKKCLEGLEVSLKNSVERQMECDVNWGCQLSGGVDSSLISYYASKVRNHPMKDTVSLVPKDKKYSEAEFIRQVAKKNGNNNHEFVYDDSNLLENLESVIWHYETILHHKSAIGMKQLCQGAKNYVTVLLSGEGADELLGGYVRYSQIKIKRLFPKYWNKNYPSLVIGEDRLNSLQDFNKGLFIHDDISLITKTIINERKQLVNSFTGTKLDKQIKYEMSTYLTALLERQDKMSMANSIETRVPFLDNEMVDYAFQIPEKYLIKFRFKTLKSLKEILKKKFGTAGKPLLDGKYLLKELCKEKYGVKFAYRTKQGMNLPVNRFLASKEFKIFFYNKLYPKMKERKILNADWVKDKIEHIDQTNRKEFDTTWNAICFEIWCQLYIDVNNLK